MVSRGGPNFGHYVMAFVSSPAMIRQGVKIGEPYYRGDMLRFRLFPEIRAKLSANWAWQQDNAPSHR